MDFLFYLLPNSMDVYNMISKKIKIVENAPICSKREIFGFYESDKKRMTICTNIIKKFNNVTSDVNLTFLHESVHMAQSCKTNFKYLTPLGVNPSIMRLDSAKEDVLNEIISRNSALKYIDMEAFWMEDKPQKVKHAIQKYCF